VNQGRLKIGTLQAPSKNSISSVEYINMSKEIVLNDYTFLVSETDEKGNIIICK
jgi:hypothetical protein